MIDVAIGLVLVLAIASLLVTALQEGLASLYNTRGKNLVKAIASLLGDNNKLADDLLKHALVKSTSLDLGKGGEQRPPSYMSADVFVTALLSHLGKYSAGIRPATPGEFIANLKAKMPPEEQAFLTSLESLVSGVELDWSSYEQRLCAWFDSVGTRSIGWFKRQTQWQLFVLGLLLAAALNINPLVIVDALWNDAALRKSTVAQADLALRAYQAETGGQPAAGQTPAPAASPVVASSGKPGLRQVDDAIAKISASLDSAASALEKNPLEPTAQNTAQNTFNALSLAYELRGIVDRERSSGEGDSKQQASNANPVAELDQHIRAIKDMLSQGSATIVQYQSAIDGADALGNAIKIERDARSGSATNADARALLALGCAESGGDPAKQALCNRLQQLGALDQIGLPLGWAWATWPRVFAIECRANEVGKNASAAATKDGARDATKSAAGEATHKCGAGDADILSNPGVWKNAPFALLGWLITALAVTLGAPFWFDLLGKLIKLRSSGARPTDNAGPAQDSGGAGGTLTKGAAAGSGGPPPVAAPAAASEDAMGEAERSLAVDEITRIQRQLGLPAASQNGRLDLNTRTAIATWQGSVAAPATGTLTAAQINTLLNPGSGSDDNGYVG